MTELAKYLKANRAVAGTPCAWCNDELKFGEDSARCEACGTLHHFSCWNEQGGCNGPDCVNRPFQHEEITKPEGLGLSADKMECPHCHAVLSVGTALCTKCGQPTSATGEYDGPMTLAPGAQKSLTYGIIGCFLLGIILGPLAIKHGNAAKRLMAEDVTLRGHGMATIGIVLGWFDIMGFVLVLFFQLGSI